MTMNRKLTASEDTRYAFIWKKFWKMEKQKK